MENDTILIEAQKLREEIESSALYAELRSLSLAIQNDSEIQQFAQKRDSFYRQAGELPEGEERHKLLVEAKKLDDSIHSKEIVKKYDILYTQMKEILSHLETGIRRILP